jgi:hypothetical protein
LVKAALLLTLKELETLVNAGKLKFVKAALL